MDRRASFTHFFCAITARFTRSAYLRGYRFARRDLIADIEELEQELADTRKKLGSELAAAYEKIASDAKTFAAEHSKQADDNDAQVRELNRQIAILKDTAAIKQSQIDQLSEINARDRERVMAELAEASRRIVEITDDPTITARPINAQR